MAQLYGARPLYGVLVLAGQHGCPWDVMACREAAYARAGERCDERGLPRSLAQEPAANPGGAAADGRPGSAAAKAQVFTSLVLVRVGYSAWPNVLPGKGTPPPLRGVRIGLRRLGRHRPRRPHAR